jgi:hypothetical protein
MFGVARQHGFEVAAVPSAMQHAMPLQHSSYAASPGSKAVPSDDHGDLHACEHLSDATIILQEEDAGQPADDFFTTAVPAATAATTDAMALGDHDEECESTRKRRRTASFADAQVDSAIEEAAALAGLLLLQGEDTPEANRAAAPAGTDEVAAGSSSRSSRIVLPGHSAILHGSSSYCKAMLRSWRSSGKDGKTDILITVPAGAHG